MEESCRPIIKTSLFFIVGLQDEEQIYLGDNVWIHEENDHDVLTFECKKCGIVHEIEFY